VRVHTRSMDASESESSSFTHTFISFLFIYPPSTRVRPNPPPPRRLSCCHTGGTSFVCVASSHFFLSIYPLHAIPTRSMVTTHPPCARLAHHAAAVTRCDCNQHRSRTPLHINNSRCESQNKHGRRSSNPYHPCRVRLYTATASRTTFKPHDRTPCQLHQSIASETAALSYHVHISSFAVAADAHGLRVVNHPTLSC
jgi:hypothetical protein